MQRGVTQDAAAAAQQVIENRTQDTTRSSRRGAQAAGAAADLACWYLETAAEGGQLRRISIHALPFRVGRRPALQLTLPAESSCTKTGSLPIRLATSALTASSAFEAH